MGENRQAAYVECWPMRRQTYEVFRLAIALANAGRWFTYDPVAADRMRDHTPGIVWW